QGRAPNRRQQVADSAGTADQVYSKPNQRRNSLMQNRHIIFGAILSAIAILPETQAVSPSPDGCYPNFTTAEGCNALKFLTSGVENPALGAFALYKNNEGGPNTGFGLAALALNTADSNTAVGATALLLNTTGDANTAVGRNALTYNGIASDNNAF